MSKNFDRDVYFKVLQKFMKADPKLFTKNIGDIEMRVIQAACKAAQVINSDIAAHMAWLDGMGPR